MPPARFLPGSWLNPFTVLPPWVIVICFPQIASPELYPPMSLGESATTHSSSSNPSGALTPPQLPSPVLWVRPSELP